ncbi:unnamed protein product [Paramecium sonneborni]|uniref:Uncharacterized protein n=1 Tax=Paramecium sonneborni TaxID=65129 RepID=A0A8S1PZ84_9CILI|nr:unnamed protein product [Paramecium sonneborni]
MILLFNMNLIANQFCLRRQFKMHSILRGHYKNVLYIGNGALISSKISNVFYGGNNGSCLKDSIYILSVYQWCGIGSSIKLDLLQNQELNTLKIWFQDGDNRLYRIKIYIIFDNKETQIYNDFTKSVFIITFPQQMVSGFRILNVAGNTYNSNLHFIKAEAYYKFQVNKLQ